MIEQEKLIVESTAPDSESKNEDLIKQTEGKTAGQILRAAREEQGIDIGLLASNLKVSARQLEQLELDQYDQLPDMAFTRNFAISVARRLKVDEKLIAGLLPKMSNLTPSNHGHLAKYTHDARGALMRKEVRPYRKRSKLWWFLLLALLVALVVVAFFLPQLSSERNAQDHTLASTQASNVIGDSSSTRFVTREVGISSLNMRSEPVAVSQNLTPVEPPQAGSVQALSPVSSSEDFARYTGLDGETSVTTFSNTDEQQQAAELTTAPVLPENTVGAVSSNDKLEVRAGSESWLRIQSASGKIVYEGLVKKGNAYVLSLKKDELPLSVRIGKATDAVVTVRGKALNLSSSIVGDIANFKVE